MDLVPGKSQQINAHPFRINPIFAVGLHRVHMEQRLGIDALYNLGNLLDGLHRTDLIVDKHHRHENGFRRHGRPQGIQFHNAVVIHRQIGHRKALAFQIFHRLQHRRMLDLGRDQMLSGPLVGHGRANERQIVRFRAAGSEKDLLFLHFQVGSNDRTGVPHVFLRVHALLMHGGRIAVVLQHGFHHHLRHLRKTFRGGGIIQIYFHLPLFLQ